MRNKVGMLVVVVALMLGLGVAFEASAVDEDRLIERFVQKLDQLVGRCVNLLENASSVAGMDRIAAACERAVFVLVHQLERQLGHEIEFETFHVCVYNEALDHTACFDPINIVG